MTNPAVFAVTIAFANRGRSPISGLSVSKGVALVLMAWLLLEGNAGQADPTMCEQIEADWLRQAAAWQQRARNQAQGPSVPSSANGDAAGAVDGVKNGKYGFHTGLQGNPWWQVDLGQPVDIARLVVYNRLDYAPGLHNADRLRILTSEDGKQWTLRHDNQGSHFGGISGAPPLEVAFQKEPVRARFVRLQIPSDQPIFFHLDEVEVYGTEAPEKNLALRCPAAQSSVSQWSTDKLAGRPANAPVELTQHVIQRGRRLAAELRAAGVDTRSHEQVLSEVAARIDGPERDFSNQQLQQLYFKARWAVRRLVFSNPLLAFDKLLLVKRFTQETYPDVCLNHMPWVSRPGGDICILTLAGTEDRPEVRALLDGALGPGHVHGIDLSWDAKRIVFGYARAKTDGPPDGWLDRRTNFDLRRNEEPIHLFEIGVDGGGLSQLTRGQWSDLDPTYLPNGEVAFASERCGYSLQCNEYDKDETSCNLYVMRPDGSHIRRLSASKDGDYLPHCLDDGSIGYTRWEYQERGWAHIQSIWAVRPDGTGADALFKQHLNEPWALEDARSIPGTGSRKLAAIATGHHTLPAGPVVVVTPSVGLNDSAAIRIVTPDVRPPEGGMSGTTVNEGGVPDGSGYYMNPWPLSEKHFLVAYSYAHKQNDPTGYAVYLIDVFGNKELIYRDLEISCFMPIPLRARACPLLVPDVRESDEPHATCAVANVTHGVDGIASRSARYLRISHRLAWPYDNRHGGQRYHEVAHTQGVVPNWTPVRVLGEVPLDPDGSAHFQVPADVPVYFQLLDENHMELRRMRSFISFQPGERRMCVGCHETRAEAPAAQKFPTALLRDPLIPTPPPWGTQPVSFLRDIQPILDKHCAGCHDGLKPAAGLDFSGGLTSRRVIPAFAANRAYDTLRVQDLVSRSNIHDDARVTAPLAFGSARSKLVDVLRNGSCGKRVKLSKEEWLHVVTWIDANAPYHDRFINKRAANRPYDLPADGQLLQRIAAVHTRRCQSCHDPAEVTRADWIDLHGPQRSRFLAAPLAKAAGGRQQCGQAVYRDQGDQDYRAVSDLLEAACRKAWEYPRRDLAALQH